MRPIPPNEIALRFGNLSRKKLKTRLLRAAENPPKRPAWIEKRKSIRSNTLDTLPVHTADSGEAPIV